METQNKKSHPQPIVCCSNLSSKTTPLDLKELFEKTAVPTQIHIKARQNGTLVAIVHFETLEECENIIKEYNYYTLYKKQINIALKDTLAKTPAEGNIIVKNLPDNMNSKDLEGVFKMFGPIVRCKVASDAEGNPLGYGYVQYKNVESAKRAVGCCKSVKLGTKVLEVCAYDPQVRKSQSKATDFFTNCFMKNFPLTLTKERLIEILEKYGKVTSVYFPLKEDKTPVGFACANFEKPEQAQGAIEGLHNKKISSAKEMNKEDGIEVPAFYIQRAEERENRTESLRKQMESLSIGGTLPRCNLYVSNIPTSFTKEEILDIFIQFGKIVDFKISEGAAGSNKMYGYVCYSTPEEACLAFEKVDGSYLDGSRLKISYYKTKKERKAEQENSERATTAKERGNENSERNSSLYNYLMKVGDEYKDAWSTLNVSSRKDFALAILKEAKADASHSSFDDETKMSSYVDEILLRYEPKKTLKE